jgi:hypothetical protein
MSRELLDFSAAVPAGMGNLEKAQFPVSWVPETWHVYEFPTTNTGNYSPTVLYRVGTAPEMLEKMASPEFDYRNDAVVTEDLGETLVPLKEMKLSFERGAAQVQGTSDGASLSVLPLQFSHCLRLSDPNARIVRADLALVGVLFKDSLDAEITDDFSPFTPGCRAADTADIKRMKIAIDHTNFPTDDGSRPTAIKAAADVVPNLIAVLGQIK